jgi:hypothetical protein
MNTIIKKVRFSILLTLTLFVVSGDLFSQSSTEIIFTDEFTGDTTWSVNSIDFELNVDWTVFDNEYLYFGGTFKTTFENFTNHVDSITMDVENSCWNCFEIILFKSGEDSVFFETPSGQSIQTIVNPWTDNPDGLIMWTGEGAIRVETIYYNGTSGQPEIDKTERVSIFPNPATDFFKLKQLAMNSAIKVYNTSGTLLLEAYVTLTDNKIDISSLNNGIYLIKIQSENKTQNLKLLKVGY